MCGGKSIESHTERRPKMTFASDALFWAAERSPADPRTICACTGDAVVRRGRVRYPRREQEEVRQEIESATVSSKEMEGAKPFSGSAVPLRGARGYPAAARE